MPAKILENEAQRLRAVDRTGVMYLDQDNLYEIYCFLAKEITGCAISWTGLIDDKNQFCLARDGLPENAGKIFPRQQTFCQYALSSPNPLIVENMQKDKRFKNHPFVVDGSIKFYAGFPIVTGDGYTLGTLCIGDSKVKKLSSSQLKLMIGLTAKLAYQLQIQENYKNKSAENLMIILEKISKKIEKISSIEVKIILKFFLGRTLSQSEKTFLIKKALAEKSGSDLKITKFGNELRNDLSINTGILKTIKNMTSKDYNLSKMLQKLEDL